MTARSEVLFVGGAAGVGKSSVAAEMHAVLSAAAVRHAVIEGDVLDLCWPTAFEHCLAEDNLTAVWANYRRLGYRRLIYTNTVSVLEASRLAEAMGDEPVVTAVLLTADAATVEHRLRRRELGSEVDAHLQRSRERAVELEERAPASVHRVDTAGRDLSDLAAEVIELAGWHRPAEARVHEGSGTEWFDRAGGEPVLVVAPSTRWSEDARRWLALISERVARSDVRLEHIGSTAVPGLPAKPVLDLQLAVPDLADEAVYRPALEALGLVLRAREPGHRFFRPAAGTPRTVHVHVCGIGSDWERDHLRFRDALRSSPRTAEAYAALKRQLADTVGHDRIAYTEGKTAFVHAVLAGWRA